MAKESPFDEDVMTLIMGLGGPEEPGQHGPTKVKGAAQENTAFEFIMQLRDMCEEFIQGYDKEETKDVAEEDMEEEDTEEEE